VANGDLSEADAGAQADDERRINKIKAAALVLGCLALTMVTATDYLTTSELSFGAFYILVMLAVAWFCGPWWGVLFAFLSTFAQLEIGLVTGTTFSEPVYLYLSNGNRLFAYLVIVLLVAVVRSNYTRLQAAARIDYITGVTNSHGFYEKLSVEMARHRRSRAAFAVAYLNCDYFKVVNEGLGRSEGDRVLAAIGQVIKSNLRETDIVARLGGDEFALVLPNSGEVESAQVVRKLCTQLESAMTRHDWPLTFSVGVGVFLRVPEHVDSVIAYCERVMQRVKAGGKNKVMVRVFDPDENTVAPRAPLHVVR
jgi:diguanylate cyclase (GGDEF)-like protein